MLVYVDAIAKENCAQAPNKREIQYIAVFISVPSTFSQPMSGALLRLWLSVKNWRG